MRQSKLLAISLFILVLAISLSSAAINVSEVNETLNETENITIPEIISEQINQTESNKTLVGRTVDTVREYSSLITGQAVAVASDNKGFTGGALGFLAVVILLGLYDMGLIGPRIRRARVLHNKAQRANIKGNYSKSMKLYRKSNKLRRASLRR